MLPSGNKDFIIIIIIERTFLFAEMVQEKYLLIDDSKKAARPSEKIARVPSRRSFARTKYLFAFSLYLNGSSPNN